MISEDSSKKRRGRPPLLSADQLAFVTAMVGRDGLSTRAQQDTHYTTLAIGFLGTGTPEQVESWTWLLDMQAYEAGEKSERQAMKRSLLAALGRYDDVGAMFAMASFLCRVRPTVRRGIAMIRKDRLGRGARAPRATSTLRVRLQRVLADYRLTHPDVPHGEVARVLQDLWQDARERERVAAETAIQLSDRR